MERHEFVELLESRGFVLEDESTWVMGEQPPEPWARMGARITGENRYESLIYFRSGGVAVSERGLRFEQTSTLFAAYDE